MSARDLVLLLIGAIVGADVVMVWWIATLDRRDRWTR